MQRRTRFILGLAFIAFIIILSQLYISFYGPAGHDATLKTVIVARGAPFGAVARCLESEGLIRSRRGFIFAGWLMGAQRDTKAGEYAFSASMSPVEIIRMLKGGEVKKYILTVPEGYTVREIAGLLEKKGLATADAFVARALDPAFANRLGLPGPTLEGYLFPDTYSLKKGMSVDEIIGKMTRRFREVYDGELSGLASSRGMNPREVVTLASMIEKETSEPSERPIISSVFHNRLGRGVKLQSDPTVIYAIKAFDGNIRKKDLDIRSPYNTYTHYGLPPGPIANPGLESMRAALKPADTKYLYFVSKNDGTHYFSKTYREHEKAVERFQKRRRGKRAGK